jgi:RNA polymerase sigma factor (TIGR02999 family)
MRGIPLQDGGKKLVSFLNAARRVPFGRLLERALLLQTAAGGLPESLHAIVKFPSLVLRCQAAKAIVIVSQSFSMAVPGDITRLLQEWKDGQPEAFQQLVPLVYSDLRRIAYSCLQREQPGHTLQATGLVHELYLRLCNQRAPDWADRAHFFTFTAKIMRMILIDHARRNLRLKRGGPSERVPLSEHDVADQLPWFNLNGPEYIDLDSALDELEQIDARKAHMVELCHLLGCTTQESADILQVSLATAERDLKFARGWLYSRLRPGQAEQHG